MALSYYHLNEFLKKNPQYGATPEQALKAAATGAVTGAIFAGVSGMAQAGNWGRAATMSANSLTGGAMARVQGGDFVTGMGYMFATQAAAWGYESVAGYGADPNPGQDDPTRTTYDPEAEGKAGPKGMDVIGKNSRTGANGLPAFNEQGGALGTTLNKVPGINATAHLHDSWWNTLPSDGVLFRVFNYPTMLPAAAISYAGMMPAPLTVEMSVKQRR